MKWSPSKNTGSSSDTCFEKLLWKPGETFQIWSIFGQQKFQVYLKTGGTSSVRRFVKLWWKPGEKMSIGQVLSDKNT
jgi:hypothetical protein